jgi:hypothetical protein
MECVSEIQGYISPENKRQRKLHFESAKIEYSYRSRVEKFPVDLYLSGEQFFSDFEFQKLAP